MSIEDKLSYLNETKQQIKQAIISKGVNIADSDSFRSYADKISNISGGGSIEPKPSISGFGLVGYADALANTAKGEHSTSASNWYTLDGSFLSQGGSPASYWVENGLKITSTKNPYMRFGSPFKFVTQANGFTIEGVFTLTKDISGTSQAKIIFGSVQSGGATLRIYPNTNSIYGSSYDKSTGSNVFIYIVDGGGSTGEDLSNSIYCPINKPVYACFRYDGNKLSLYTTVSNTIYTSTESYPVLGESSDGRMCIGYDGNSTGQIGDTAYNADMIAHSFRYYKRCITDEEMHNNLAFDRARYNIPTDYRDDVIFTINPTPSTAEVILTSEGYTQEGNSIAVKQGDTVEYTVRARGYIIQSGSAVASASSPTLDITLEPIPETYEVLESLTKTDRQNAYLDTKYLLKTNTTVRMRASTPAMSGYFFGISDNNVAGWGTGIASSNLSWYIYGAPNRKLYLSETGIIADKIYDIKQTPEGLWLDNEQLLSAPNSGVSNTLNLWLFAAHFRTSNSATIATGSLATIYDCQIYEDDVLKLDLIPVKQVSTGIYGMYDQLNENFYPVTLNSSFKAN